MSDPTAELETPPVRESAAGVVGIGLGLSLILLLVLVVLVQGSRPIDGRELLEGSFAVETLPFGLEIVDASQVATGERFVVLEAPGTSEPERSAESLADGDDGDDDEEYDWTTLEEGEPGTSPIQAFLIWYPKRGAERALDRQFKEVRWKDLRDFEAKGGRLMLDKGVLDWTGYDAGYVIERELERGGTFRDWMRVNLSLGDQACILVARWARGSPAAKERVEELLGQLEPLAERGEGDVGGG